MFPIPPLPYQRFFVLGSEPTHSIESPLIVMHLIETYISPTWQEGLMVFRTFFKHHVFVTLAIRGRLRPGLGSREKLFLKRYESFSCDKWYGAKIENPRFPGCFQDFLADSGRCHFGGSETKICSEPTLNLLEMIQFDQRRFDEASTNVVGVALLFPKFQVAPCFFFQHVLICSAVETTSSIFLLTTLPQSWHLLTLATADPFPSRTSVPHGKGPKKGLQESITRDEPPGPAPPPSTTRICFSLVPRHAALANTYGATPCTGRKRQKKRETSLKIPRQRY